MEKFKIMIQAVDKFSSPFKKATKMIKSLASSALGVGKGLAKVAAGIAAAVAAVGFVVSKYVSMLDKIGKTSQKLGIDPEFLQKLRFAAEQTGVKVEALDMGLQRFIRRTAEAAKGTGEAKQALESLGIQLFDNNNNLRNIEDVFFDVADAIANTTDAGEQVRLAFKFFDSEGVALVATLKNGSAGLKEFYQEAENLGLIISRQTIKKAEKFADAFNIIKKQITSVVASILGAFLPALEQISSKFSNLLATGRGLDGTFDELGKTIGITLVNQVADSVIAFGSFLDIFEIGFVKAKNTALDFAIAILNALDSLPLMEVELSKITSLTALYSEATGQGGMQASLFAEKIRQVGMDSINAKAKLDELNKGGAGFGTTTKSLNKFGEGFNQVFNDGANKFADMEALGVKVGNTLESGLTDAFMNIGKGAEGLKDMMDGILKQILAELIRVFIVQQAVGLVKNALGFGGVDGKAAKGGTIGAGKTFLVGEEGPELFTPGRTGMVTPNDKIGTGGETPNVNITYNIQSFDSKDTLQAITENAPTISAIIQNEFSKHGRRGFA